MDDPVQFVIQARTSKIGELVEACARRTLNFGDLCKQVAEMGYQTTSLYEMVRAVEWEIKNG